MYVVMGATGNVGGAVAIALLDRGEAVTTVVRDARRAAAWRDRGAEIVEADIEDVASLRAAFALGKRAFLLNPPADVTGDTDTAELHTIANILAALDGSGLEKVVAASTYGARPGRRQGDLSTLWQLEEGLRRQPIPAAINRGAYYMTNWLPFSDAVRRTGKLTTMIPADMPLPMVAPSDLGDAAADRLMSSVGDVGVRHVEGPQRYTPRQVADAFARALRCEVEPAVAPREAWGEIFRTVGFSDAAADAYGRMTAAVIDEAFAVDDPVPVRGSTSLEEFVSRSLAGDSGPER